MAKAILSLRLKVSLYFYAIVVFVLALYVRFDHFFGYWTYCRTKIASPPQVLTPVTLFKFWKFILQQTG